MAVFGITDNRGRVWAFDPDLIYAIQRAAVRTRIIRQRSHVVTHSAGMFLPTTYNLETNWSGYRGDLESQAAHMWTEAEMSLRNSPETFFGNLVGLLNDAINDHNWYRQQSRDCTDRSHQSISRVVRNWERALEGARFVRDASATVLVVTAGVVAAPAGAAAAGAAGMTGASLGSASSMLAAGSVMRGAFTYQDTGNVGSAVLNAGGTFTVGMIGIGSAGMAMSRADQALVLAISSAGAGATAGGQALVEGQNMRQVAVAAIGGAGGQALGGVLGPRIENLGFVTQVAAGSGVDLAVGRATSAAVDRLGSQSLAAPQARGHIDFLGLPASAAVEYVRGCALRPL
jgi:hypothetical protein